jgi:NADH:ubiquinone oxidoreductase subunit 2 (subunit N)
MILFTTCGATFLMSSADLVSAYLSIELQSFAVYILATLYRDSESATSAGLKYFQRLRIQYLAQNPYLQHVKTAVDAVS